MYEFLDRLISTALPRIRDFRGVNPNSFDGHGNYSLGLAEQVVFPEIDADKILHAQGMDITIVTSAVDDEGGKALLDAFGFPFKRGNEVDFGFEPQKKRRGQARGPKGRPVGRKK